MSCGGKSSFCARFDIGQIVYFTYTRSGRMNVGYGTVEEIYHDVVLIQLYEIVNTRRVNGVLLRDMPNVGRWMKLPKNWSYNTRLYEDTYDLIPLDKPLSTDTVERIQTAIDCGALVKACDNPHVTVDVEIDKNHGYRIVTRGEGYRNIATVRHNDVYKTYAEAQSAVDEYERELRRVCDMTDDEWSVWEMDKTLDVWMNGVGATTEERDRIRKFLLSLGNVADIEIRISGNEIQWKYWKNKRWNNIEIDVYRGD